MWFKFARVARRLGLARLFNEPPKTGLVAAIVCIDSSQESGNSLTEEQEEQILARLSQAVEANAGGKFDGAEKNSTQVIQWYFFGRDVRALEDALLPALRREPRCSGGLLRLTSNGIAGPWREIRI